LMSVIMFIFFFFSSRRRHTRSKRDWGSDVCSSDLPKGIILSGGPQHINEENSYQCDEEIFDLGIPILGVCYGTQLMAHHFGGKVEHIAERTYDKETIQIANQSGLFDGSGEEETVWLSKGDQIVEAPDSFQVDATSETAGIVAISHREKNLYGVQFHPEVEDTKYGKNILKQFLFSICKYNGDYTIESFIENEVENIRKQVGDQKVLCALSGGVDSSVVAALIHKAIGDQLTCIFVDHGLLRKNEADDVMKLFADEFHMNIDRKSTRLNSSHVSISYAVFCLKKKKFNKYYI